MVLLVSALPGSGSSSANVRQAQCGSMLALSGSWLACYHSVSAIRLHCCCLISEKTYDMHMCKPIIGC